jgi:hypothetical protein
MLIIALGPSNSSSDSDDGVPGIIEVSSDSGVEKFVKFEPVMEVEPEMDIVVQKKLKLRILRSISLGRNIELKAIIVIIVLPLMILR